MRLQPAPGLALASAPLLLLGALGCSDSATNRQPVDALPALMAQVRADPDALPPLARLDVVETLLESRGLTYHPSDGGGRVELMTSVPERPTVSSPVTISLDYITGPEGIDVGGMIFLQVSPFWDWSTPQASEPAAPGYTSVETTSEGVTLTSETLDQQLLGIRVGGRALVEGDRVRIVYGAGSVGAFADRYAEKESPLWIAVDGDGDGIRKVLVDPAVVEVLPGPLAQLQVTIPTIARPGERIPVVIAGLDAQGNRGASLLGSLRLLDAAPVLALPERIEFTADDGGVKRIEGMVMAAGTVRLRVEGPDGLEGRSNPMDATLVGPRILWGDLHGHSNLSDGTGTPEDYFRYARDVAALDVVALTDHDHWGILALDDHPKLWERIQQAVRDFHDPGHFVTLHGYEWTSWIYGHRHVLFFEDEATLWSSLDPATDTPRKLWKALDGSPALTFAHHSAGGPIPTDWRIPPDPRFEPVTEVVSVHGSSEAMDSPGRIYDALPGNFVRDALDMGYKLGFIGSGDSHDGHPGLAHLAAPQAGLAAIISEERTRAGVLAALRARRVYATNGPRILLRVALGAHPMGSTITVEPGQSIDEVLIVRVLGTAPLKHVDLIRSGELVDGVEGDESLDTVFQRKIEGLRAGEYVYVRVVQQDGGIAWSSPIFIE